MPNKTKVAMSILMQASVLAVWGRDVFTRAGPGRRDRRDRRGISAAKGTMLQRTCQNPPHVIPDDEERYDASGPRNCSSV